MKKIPLHPDPNRAKEVAFTLLKALEEDGIFGEKELPDDVALKVIDGTDDELFLSLVTLTTSLDYMRNANKLWESSINTLKDEEVNWVFSPKEVTKRGKEKLKKALMKHGLAAKKDKDTEIWYRISETLTKEFNGSIKKFFERFNYDVKEMFETLHKKEKEKFPSLSGIKIFPHWIRSLKDKKNLPFKNVEKLPIPVDVHVARATFTTGCITGKYKAKGITETLRKKVIEVWEKGLEGTGISPIEMFRPLWLLSKHGCHYRKNGERPKLDECPVKDFCVDGKVIVTSKKVEIET